MKPAITLEIKDGKAVNVIPPPEVIVEIFDYDTSKYYESHLEEDANKRLCRRIRYLRGGTSHSEEPVKIAILNGKIAKVIIPQNLGVMISAKYVETNKIEEFQ